MSRSNPSGGSGSANPAKLFIEWSSTNKCFKYYDKEKEENVLIKLPFKFLVLDILATIKGYSDTDQSGFWSNEVRSTKTEELTVRTRKGVSAKGMYDDIIASRDLVGAKFCQSVYIMMYQGTTPILANLQLTGAALGEWFDFLKAERKASKDYNIIFKKGIQVSDTIEAKKGATTFNKPVFKLIEVSEATNLAAFDLDAELQEYLTEYLGKAKPEQTNEQEDEISKGEQTNRLYAPPPTMDDAPEEKEENPFDESDTPF